MKTIVIESTIKIGTRNLSSQATHEGEGLLDLSTELPAGVAAEIATKTDGDTCTITLPEGHGLASGDYNVFWGTASVHYGAAGTVNSNTLSLDGGAGTDFPAAETAVVVSEQVEITAPLSGDLLIALVAHCVRRAHVDFQTGAGASLLARALAANKEWHWSDDSGFTNPLAGQTLAKILASCGESEGTGDLSIPILYDAVA